MRRRLTLTLPLLVATLLPLATLAGGSITVPKKVAYEKGIHIPDAVRTECDLEQKTAEHVRKALGGKFDKVNAADSVSSKTAGKALTMKITSVLAPGGGSWSGPKSVEVRGTLWENGKQLGSFTARRNTTRGRGTCGMLERNAKEIASDIAKWIEAPGKDSRLGDSKK